MKKEFNIILRALLFIAIAVAAWLIGIMIGQENAVTILNPDVSSGTLRNMTNPVFSVMIDYNNGDIDTIDKIDMKSKANLWEAMNGVDSSEGLRLNQNEDYPDNDLQWYGINDFYNSGDARWYIWLNNDYQSSMPDQIVVKSGDVLYFKYLSYYPR
jgi:hypothetical protein